MFNSKVFLAEFIGTFALVFIGAGTGMAGAGLLAVALAHGLTLAVFAYAYGHISGTHVNPAVTVAMAATGKLKMGEAAVSYLVPQFAGAALAGLFLNFIADTVGANIAYGATVGALTTSTPWLAGLVELVLTFFLVNTILNTAVSGKGGALSGLAIGLTLTAAILVGGAFTGASLNPARTFGIALFAADPSLANANTYLIYLMGPLFGATLAALVYIFLNSVPDESEADDEPEAVKPAPVAEAAPKRVARKAAVRRTVKK